MQPDAASGDQTLDLSTWSLMFYHYVTALIKGI